MILLDAPGSSGIQDALENEHVKKIVDIFLDIREEEKIFFNLVARFLQEYSGFPSKGFARRLEALKNSKFRNIDSSGQRFSSSSFSPNDLFSAIEALYDADEEDIINYRRGAIVELLTYELVNSRCQEGECKSNQCLRYGTYTSKQIDIVVFSKSKGRIEGYSCKIKSVSADCSGLRDLVDLSDEGKKSSCDICVGIVSFDNSSVIQQRLQTCSMPDAPSIDVPYLPHRIRAYGLNNLSDLTRSPFR